MVITTKRGAKYAGVTLGLDKGAWNYERTLARVGLAGDWGSGHIQATRRTSDDYYFQSPYTTGTLDGSLRFNLGERTDATLNFEQSRRNKDKHGNVTGASQAEGDPTGTVGRDFARKFNVDLDKINLTLAHDLAGGGNLLGTVYQYKDHTIFWSSPQNYSATGTRITDVNAYTTLNNYRQTQNGAKGEWRHKFSNLAWMTGIDLRHNEYKNYNTALTNYCSRPGASCTVTPAGTIFQNDKTDEKTRAFYGELKWMPLTDWVFTANARNDFIDLHYKGLPNSSNTNAVEKGKTFSVNSWRLGANWSLLPNVSLFSNISTGFRTPTAQQLYGGSISPTGSTRNNENLKPETATNYEIGTNASSSLLGIGYNIQASLFQIERKNYIMSVNGDYGQSNTTYQQYYDNIGGVRNRGLELALKTDAKREWSLDVAYTYVDARFTNYDNLNRTLGNPYATGSGACNTTNTPSNTACRIARANVTGNTVPRVPRHQLFSTLHWHPASGLQIGLEMDAKSDAWADEINQEKIPGRTLFNLGMTYDLNRVAVPLIGGKWSFFARVDNLFDRKYWTTARGTNDAASNYGATPGVYNGIYDANDLSIITGKPRAWMAGITASF